MHQQPQLQRHNFRLLAAVPSLVHGVFTRHGGVSAPPYDSLNVGWSNGDAPEAVRENLHRVKQSLGLKQLVGCRQVHGDALQLVDAALLDSAANCGQAFAAAQGDALATDRADVGLLIKIADCQAVFLVDPIRRVAANVHCGWRGSVTGVLLKAVRKLNAVYGCRSQDLLAAISPSLGPCCAEFRHYRRELPPIFWDFQIKPEYFDFWAISRWQLTRAGVPAENIEVAARCTRCESDHFYSYRGEGVTGRLAAVVGWLET